jgi:chitinase
MQPVATSTKITRTPSTTAQTTYPTNVGSQDGYRAVGYFGNWDIYARKFFPQDIPADKLTHVLYAFGDNKADGTVFFTDTYADTDIHYAGDSWSENGTNVGPTQIPINTWMHLHLPLPVARSLPTVALI